ICNATICRRLSSPACQSSRRICRRATARPAPDWNAMAKAASSCRRPISRRHAADLFGSVAATMAALVSPHGGRGLRPLQVASEQLAEEHRRAQSLPKVRITSREKGDLVMLGIGGFTPLEGFMGRDDWRRVCDELRLANGLFWPIPVTPSTDDASLTIGAEIALADPEDGAPLATMAVNEKCT